MAWLEGSAEEKVEIEATVDEVASFFASPDRFEHCIDDLDELESTGDDTWRYRLEEFSAKGISFQGEYFVEYGRDGNVVTWDPTESDDGEEGNMRSEGRVEVTDLGDGVSEVVYQQTISVELPIPSLMTGAFEPIVSREVQKSAESMLDCVKETLGDG